MLKSGGVSCVCVESLSNRPESSLCLLSRELPPRATCYSSRYQERDSCWNNIAATGSTLTLHTFSARNSRRRDRLPETKTTASETSNKFIWSLASNAVTVPSSLSPDWVSSYSPFTAAGFTPTGPLMQRLVAAAATAAVPRRRYWCCGCCSRSRSDDGSGSLATSEWRKRRDGKTKLSRRNRCLW